MSGGPSGVHARYVSEVRAEDELAMGDFGNEPGKQLCGGS